MPFQNATLIQQTTKKTLVLDRKPDADVADRFENDPAYLQSLVDVGNFALTVSKLMKGTDTYVCRTAAHAKAYQNELTEGLKTLKNYLADNASTPEKTTFEL